MRKTRVLLTSLYLVLAPYLAHADESLPKTQALDDEIALGVDGCVAKVPRDGGCVRLVCRGTGVLFGQSGSDLQEATKEANLDARGRMAQYLGDSVKVSEDMARVNQVNRASSSDGGNNTSKSASRLTTLVNSSRAEELFRGVAVLEREVDPKSETVVVKIGTSCNTKAVADAMDSDGNGMVGTEAPKVSIDPAQNPEAYHSKPSQLPRVRQTVQSEDDF